MTKPLGFHGVETEKAEAMRRYNNRRNLPNILRAAVVALLGYLWFPTLAISLQITGCWFHRTGMAIITNRFVLFVFTNLLVALIFLLSSNNDNDESSNGNTEPDLYEQYTSSSSTTVKDVHSNKQIVPAFIPEEVVEANRDVVITTYGEKRFNRTTKKKKNNNNNSVTVSSEFRRTESARVEVEEDDWGLSSEQFRLKVETFIMEKKKSILQENDVVVQCQGLTLLRASAGYASC